MTYQLPSCTTRDDSAETGALIPNEPRGSATAPISAGSRGLHPGVDFTGRPGRIGCPGSSTEGRTTEARGREVISVQDAAGQLEAAVARLNLTSDSVVGEYGY